MNRRAFIKTAGTLAACSWLPGALASQLSSGKVNASWSSAARLPIKVQEIYPAVHKRKLYVAGGISSRFGIPYFSKAAFMFDGSLNQWQELPELPEALHHLALVSDGNDLLGIGGFNGGYSHTWRMRDQVYKLSNSGWEEHSSLPTPQAEGVVTAREGQVHTVTGQRPNGDANRARSDHRESTLHWYWNGENWDSLAPIPTARNSATGGWIGDNLIVTGGRTSEGNLDDTEIYDAKEDRWRRAAPMPLPQAGTASVVHDEELIVFGGEIFVPEEGVFPNVWRYSLRTDRWQALPDLPTPRHGLGAGKIGDRIFVVGGATKPSGSGTSNLNEVLLLT